MLKPDVFLRGILSNILLTILDDHVQVLDFKCGRLCNRQFYLMYSTSFSWNYDHWAHNKMSFEFGPVLALLLVSTQYSAQELLEHFNQIKGSALPFQRQTQSIRYQYKSKSRIFNILHIPNTIEESRQQTSTWFGKNSASAALKSQDILDEIQSHGYLSELDLDPEYTFIKIKMRLIHSLEKSVYFSSIKKTDWKELKNFYQLWCEEIRLNQKIEGIEGTILLEKQPQEINFWQNIQNRLEINEVDLAKEMQIAQILKDLYSLNLRNHALGFFFEVLSMHRIFFSSLEKYLIQSRFLYIKEPTC